MTNHDLSSTLAKTIAEHGRTDRLPWHFQRALGVQSTMNLHADRQTAVYGLIIDGKFAEAVTLLIPADGEPRAFVGVPA
ncbi:hypothetical protein ACLBV5_09590 [Brevundimonas sp. M1A4_2e]